MDVARSAGWWWPFENVVILTPRPLKLHRDTEGRLHNEAGAALLYPDGWGIWSHHGVRVPAKVIEEPDTLSPAEISDETNVEVRRVMMERYGFDRYLRESAAQLVSEDDYGRLWRLDQVDDEPLCMVEVINSTPEPDGSFKNYWLRVRPDCRTAAEAVAWTFGMSAEEYSDSLQIQT